MGSLCLELTTADIDGNQIVDYLGPVYSKVTKDTFNKPAIDEAKAYVEQQIAHWRQANDKKLAERYEAVQLYLSRHTSER